MRIRNPFIRLKKGPTPSDHNSVSETMVYSSAAGRVGQVDHLDDAHEFAWVDELPTTGVGVQYNIPTSGTTLQVDTTGVIGSGPGVGNGTYMYSAGVTNIKGNAGLELGAGGGHAAELYGEDGGTALTVSVDPRAGGAGVPGIIIRWGAVDLMWIIKNGSSWDYRIKTGASWVANL